MFSRIIVGISLLCTLVIATTSCSSEMLVEKVVDSKQPNAIIKDLRIVSTSQTRSDSQKGEIVTFSDEVTGSEYEFELISEEDNQYKAIFANDDDAVELSMKIVETDDNICVIEQECDGTFCTLTIKQTKLPTGEVVFDFDYDTPTTRTSYVRDTWWQCVKRMCSQAEVGLAAMVLSRISPIIGGAVGIICMDTRLRYVTKVED